MKLTCTVVLLLTTSSSHKMATIRSLDHGMWLNDNCFVLIMLRIWCIFGMHFDIWIASAWLIPTPNCYWRSGVRHVSYLPPKHTPIYLEFTLLSWTACAAFWDPILTLGLGTTLAIKYLTKKPVLSGKIPICFVHLQQKV